jgi:hypothetical protein
MEQVCLGPGGIVGHLKPGVVERTFAWFGRNRRLGRDFERTITSSEAWLYLASSSCWLAALPDPRMQGIGD